MTDDEKKRAAQAIINIPLFNMLWDELEAAAINGCINAKPDDHDTRSVMAAEARAIRNFRQRIKSLAQSAVEGKKAPA